MSPVAKKEDWKTEPFPALIKELPFERTYTPAEMQRIKQGLIPRQMEEKWFIYFENGNLHLHRSWTGNKIYEVGFLHHEGSCSTIKAIVNCDPAEYREVDDVQEVAQLDYLINYLLLR